MKKWLSIVIVVFPYFVFAQLRINEIMTNNVSAVWDDSYNFSMWVEVYNQGTVPEDITNYYFSDNTFEPQKWKPASQSIASGAFLVLWFERDDRAGHASFKLDPKGGKLYLFDTKGLIVDMLKYPPQFRNASYGRIEDGVAHWTFFSSFSPGESNNKKAKATDVCTKPIVNVSPGFYNQEVQLTLSTPDTTETIYYTTDGSEPTKQSPVYRQGTSLTISATTCIRAKALSPAKLPGDVFTGTYFINERNFSLPVVSIVTDAAFMTDNTVGIYVKGTNGVWRTCPDDVVANYNQDWDRPVSFEFFDKYKKLQLSQEIDVKVAGGCSRSNAQKSLKLTPKKKHGDNEFRYNFFPESKPHRRYEGLLYRNSGNDFNYTLLRDGFMQTLIRGRLDVDNQAYMPTVCFINGEYRGIQNLRETTDHRNIFSNYGLEEEEIRILDDTEMSTDAEFQSLVTYARDNDINTDEVLANISERLDVNSYLDYMLAQIYFNNGDWPHHNFKVWKKKENGKWRPIIYDTDFGYGLFGLTNSTTKNAILYALDETISRENGMANIYMLRRLLQNQKIKKNFIDRFCVHLSTTFGYERSVMILDSLSGTIHDEMKFHKEKYGAALSGYTNGINTMRNFATTRASTLYGYIGSYFGLGTGLQTVSVKSNISEPHITFNEVLLPSGNEHKITAFTDYGITLTAGQVPGYKFKTWTKTTTGDEFVVFAKGSQWKYSDTGTIPGERWNMPDFSDEGWKTGRSQFGWGSKGESTTISYGADANNKYITSYYRKWFTVADVKLLKQAVIKLFVDDGAVVYLNGTELKRYNMPEGEISFETKALTFNNGANVDLNIPDDILVDGENLIAVEVHQEKITTSDAIFDLSLVWTEISSDSPDTYNLPSISFTLNENALFMAVYERDENYIADSLPPVYLNEIMPGSGIHKDEFNNTDDYVEIYNNGEREIDIAGWFISDNSVVPDKYEFPGSYSSLTTIPAKGRIIVWLDDESWQGVLHANFSLNKAGEILVLSKRKSGQNDFETVDIVRFPAIEDALTYSRNPDGGPEWIIQNSTFNEPNVIIAGQSSLRSQSIIYPTLVDEYMFVRQSENEILTVVTLEGLCVLQQKVDSEQFQVRLSNLKTGVYIVRVGNHSYKIVKK